MEGKLGPSLFRFCLRLILIICFFAAPASSLSAQDALSAQINKLSNIDTSQYSRDQLVKHQYIQNLLESILKHYNEGQYKKALRLIRDVYRSTNDLPNNEEISNLLQSIENIIKIKQSESGKRSSQSHQKLNWEADETSSKDQARYLFALWITPDFNMYRIDKAKDIYRAGISTSVEFFLPYLERSIGFSGSFGSDFLDFNLAKFSNDYIIYRYSAFFQYRLTWSLPAIDQTATLTIRAGANGQFIQEFKPNSFPSPYTKSQIMPYIGVSIQDPLLYRIFQNSFNQNLIFNPTISFEYLPGENDVLAFGVSIGVYYRFGNVLIGPQYAFRMYYDTNNAVIQNNSRISFVVSTQI